MPANTAASKTNSATFAHHDPNLMQKDNEDNSKRDMKKLLALKKIWFSYNTPKWIGLLSTLLLLGALPLLADPLPKRSDKDQFIEKTKKLTTATVYLEALHIPPKPYTPLPYTYDGAAVYISSESGPRWLSAWIFLADAKEITGIVGKERIPFKLVSHNANLGLAILEPLAPLPFTPEPIQLADKEDWSFAATLFYPGTDKQHFSAIPIDDVVTLNEQNYIQLNHPLTNGYPLINEQGELIAITVRRNHNKSSFGLALPWKTIAEFLNTPDSTTAPDKID